MVETLPMAEINTHRSVAPGDVRYAASLLHGPDHTEKSTPVGWPADHVIFQGVSQGAAGFSH